VTITAAPFSSASLIVGIAATMRVSLVMRPLSEWGIAWISVLSVLNVSAQTATPSWVRARAMAIYLLVFTGGLAVGSAVWGFVAARLGLSNTLSLAAIGLLVGLAGTWRYHLISKKNFSLAPSMHWPEPVMLIETDATAGPAITSVEYRIDPNTAEEFLKAMRELKRIRLRDGAIRWNVLRDSADPERYLEVFVTESWGEHLRQHERITSRDREVERRVQSLHLGPKSPKTTHLIAEQLPK